MESVYFDELIGIHEDAIKSSQTWSRRLLVIGVALLLLGVVAFALAALKRIDAALAPSIVSMVGLITGAGSLLPYKEIPPHRLNIAKFRHLKRECEKLKDLSEEDREKRLKAINEFLGAL